MRLTLAMAVIPTIILLAPQAAASCCEGATPCLGTVTVGSGRGQDPMPTVYVDDRNYALGNSVWIYQESDGYDGLQTGGCSALVPNDCDPFVEPSVEFDQLIF